MATIESVTLDVTDLESADRFYTAIGVKDRVRLRQADAPASGFRGYTLSLTTAQPGNVDRLLEGALDAGAETLKPAEKSLWGYGAVVRAPDGSIVTIASSSKKDTGAATQQVDDFVLQLGVVDVAASREFYTEHGFTVSKSYGRKYVEFDSGRVQLTLISRRSLAKTAGVSPDGTGSHGIAIGTDAAPFTDPDGFEAETASG
jgi:predicted lactoylglutathione lyase